MDTRNVIAAISFKLVMNGLSTISEKFIGVEALGFGDANLAAMGGAWLGTSGIALAMCLAFVSAGCFSSFAIICGKKKPLEAFPFGPFIALGIWGVWLFEVSLWENRWMSLWGL